MPLDKKDLEEIYKAVDPDRPFNTLSPKKKELFERAVLATAHFCFRTDRSQPLNLDTGKNAIAFANIPLTPRRS